MISTADILRQTNPFENTIQQLLALESRDKQLLESQQNELRNKRTTISELGTKLTDFNSSLNSIINGPSDFFQPLQGNSNGSNNISVISTEGAQAEGTFNIDVQQLAKQDIVLSSLFDKNASDFDGGTNISFDLTVGTNDPVQVSVDPTGLNNQQVLNEIVQQVNDQAGETLKASVFDVDGTNLQLSFKSNEAGSDQRIAISNLSSPVPLNLNNVFAENELNAKFTIDNVNFERPDNTISDAVEGLTFRLNNTTSGTETLNINRDTETAVSNIESLIEKFNSINTFIRGQTLIDTQNGNNGILADQRSIRNLSFDLRLSAISQVSSLNGNNISALSDIGITVSSEGVMSIDNQEKLEQALAANPENVQNLFSAPDGIAQKLQQQVDRFISGSNSVIDSLKDGFDQRIERFDDRIEAADRFLAEEEERLRAEFTQLEEILNRGEFQFNEVLNFQNSLGL